jgi:hemolysin secretion/activation protein ShlB/FhaC/HecB
LQHHRRFDTLQSDQAASAAPIAVAAVLAAGGRRGFDSAIRAAPRFRHRRRGDTAAAAGFSNVRENDVFGPIYNDHIRTVSLTSDYRLQDNFGGNNYLTLAYRQGLDILGASHRDDDFLSRDGASGKFSALNFWFTRYQTLSDAWSVKIAAAGQMASGPLFLSQQFYLGGAAFGRGYGSAEISGDNGDWQADIGVAAPLSYRAPDNSSRRARLLFSLSSAFKLCPVRPQTRCL